MLLFHRPPHGCEVRWATGSRRLYSVFTDAASQGYAAHRSNNAMIIQAYIRIISCNYFNFVLENFFLFFFLFLNLARRTDLKTTNPLLQ